MTSHACVTKVTELFPQCRDSNAEVTRCCNFPPVSECAEEDKMSCQELDALQKRQTDLRAALVSTELPERKRLILQDDERSIRMAIADHKSFGHGGRACPCK